MLKEFREFALKGNMVDLAIGIIIGAASVSYTHLTLPTSDLV